MKKSIDFVTLQQNHSSREKMSSSSHLSHVSMVLVKSMNMKNNVSNSAREKTIRSRQLSRVSSISNFVDRPLTSRVECFTYSAICSKYGQAQVRKYFGLNFSGILWSVSQKQNTSLIESSKKKKKSSSSPRSILSRANLWSMRSCQK